MRSCVEKSLVFHPDQINRHWGGYSMFSHFMLCLSCLLKPFKVVQDVVQTACNPSGVLSRPLLVAKAIQASSLSPSLQVIQKHLTSAKRFTGRIIPRLFCQGDHWVGLRYTGEDASIRLYLVTRTTTISSCRVAAEKTFYNHIVTVYIVAKKRSWVES